MVKFHPTDSPHIPVLLQEVLEWSNVKDGSTVIDGTVGFGGHAIELLNKIMPSGRYLGIDKDQEAIDFCQRHLAEYKNKVLLKTGLMSEMSEIAKALGIVKSDLVLLDLGVSSPQLDDPEYGLSFKSDAELDMRIGIDGKSAADIINHWSAADLKKLFTKHGQEATNRIVAKIIDERVKEPIKTVQKLIAIVESITPRRSGIHPATSILQALRVVANQEEEQLLEGLEQAVSLLKPGGRLLVISFHSGEDRIVKRFFQQESRGCICPPEVPICQCRHQMRLKILMRQPIKPDEMEVKSNPRSRSARMRVAEKV